jgi:hypothetical protein
MPGERRFLGFVLASLVLHSLVLGLMKPSREATSVFHTPMLLHIVSPSSQTVDEFDIPTGVAQPLPTPAETGRRRYSPHASSSSFDAHEMHAAEVSAMDTPAAEVSSVNLETSARGIAQGMAREQPSDPAKSSSLDERPVLPALDRALKRAAAGERRLGDGIIQITTKAGWVYCLKPPSDFARDTPVSGMYISTTCP